MSTENAELRAKLDEAKPLLPMPYLMRRLGYDESTSERPLCVRFTAITTRHFRCSRARKAGRYKCFVGCSSGDEIAFLTKHFGISRREAIHRYLNMAGFPARGAKSHE